MEVFWKVEVLISASWVLSAEDRSFVRVWQNHDPQSTSQKYILGCVLVRRKFQMKSGYILRRVAHLVRGLMFASQIFAKREEK